MPLPQTGRRQADRSKAPKMYSNELTSAADKLSWAEEQIQEFQRQLRRFVQSEPYQRVVEIDPQTAEHVVKFRLTRPMPRELKHVTASVVGNLRATLDQAAFATAIADGKSGKFAAFPFARTEAEISDAARSRSKQIPADIFAVMASFKPYRGGNDALWALNEPLHCGQAPHDIRCDHRE
jgi:hypothetical protein